MRLTYLEFEEMFEKAKLLKKEEFLSNELLSEVEYRDSIYPNLDQKFKNYMFDLLEGKGIIVNEFFQLKDRFKLQYWANGNKQDDLNKVVVLSYCNDQKSRVIDHVNHKIEQREEFTDDESQWLKLIACILFYQKLKKESWYADLASLENDISLNSMDSKVYQALTFFRKKGFRVKVREGFYNLNLIDDVFKILDRKISEIGKDFTFEYLEYIKKFKKSYGLYFFKVHYNYQENEVIYPLGLLFRLGVKYLNKNNGFDSKEKSRRISEIFEYSLHLGNLLKLLNVGHDFSLLYSDKTNIFKIIRKYAQLDQIYKIDQYNPIHLLDLCQKLKESLDGVGIADEVLNTIKIIVEIFNLCMYELGIRDGIVFSETKSYKNLCDKYSKILLDKILDDLSHERAVNKNYNEIYGFEKINYFHKPFVKMNIRGREQYFLLDKTFFVMGFYTSIMTILRNVKKLKDGGKFDIDSHVGFLQEKIISDKILLLNINVLKTEGKYDLTQKQVEILGLKKDRNKTLETDVVIEFDDRIVFLESKKKVLTTKAKSGDEISIIKDLSDSLIESQIQANRHKRVLNNFDSIKFNDDVELFKRNREVIKVSLTQFDYGSLHTSSVMNSVLTVMLYKEVYSNDPNKISDLRSINKKLNDFTQEFGDGSSFYYAENRALMFADCHFFNFFQLLYILDKASSSSLLSIDDVLKEAFKIRRNSFDSVDVYHEFEYALYLAEFGKRNSQEIPTI